MTLSQPIVTLLRMAAHDNGFDRELGVDGGWLCFASSRIPLTIWLRDFQDADYVVALSQLHVARALENLGEVTHR